MRARTSTAATCSSGSTGTSRWPLAVLARTVLAVAGMAIASASVARDASDPTRWVGTWSASPQAAWQPVALDGQTIRQIVQVSIGGTRLRVRLSNAYGEGSLRIGAARVGLRSNGATIVSGSDRVLTFNGSESTTIPAGAMAISDPVNLKVSDRGDLAVSIYVPGPALAATEHALGLQTTYISPAGDFSGADALPTAVTTQSYYFLTGVEVGAAPRSVAIVTLGDSITDGLHSTADANKRWPNRLAERLRAQKRGNKVAVLNAGISGNRVLHDTVGTNASARLDRDVLVQSGVRYVIVLLGINDIGFPGAASAEEIIAGHRQIIDRAHAMGLKVYGGTITPFQAFLPGVYYTPDGEAKRQIVNQWIRTSKAYDAVIDFDMAIRDPGNPATMRVAYDSGDNLHPNDAGYQAMADAIDLSLFGGQVAGRRALAAGSPSTPVITPKATRCQCPP
ncbi:MAG: SGNH/GDSL hydrolase family protein [Betaproteobacteria bacterium]